MINVSDDTARRLAPRPPVRYCQLMWELAVAAGHLCCPVVHYLSNEPTKARDALVFDDRSPIYQQIADKIKEDILKGTLQEDEQVMSTNQYASFYRINPATAAKGFQQLIEEGILYKKRGIGMFVSQHAREALRKQRQERFFEEVVDAMVAEARMIGIPLRDVIRRVEESDSGGQR
jgi:GntR family transcriptional regulator